ncbi:unnamed protein product [Cylicostephanus goldi]|uniref:Uncharacterized protein n=1 Tax=Cylicostephanus goldi TaxID=71465 RepID=A0A3P7NBU0_CYLGO|nr:unnamed protein product [Cylicostephanus goldi]
MLYLLHYSYIQKVCTWFGLPAIDDSSLWSDDLCEFLVSVMNLFVVIDEYKLRNDEIVDAWRKYLHLLTALPVNFWRQVPARYWLEEKAERLEHLGTTRDRFRKKSSISPAVRDSPFRPREENKTVISPDVTFEDAFAPALWEECEKRKPPFDYRELSEIPVIKDIYNTGAFPQFSFTIHNLIWKIIAGLCRSSVFASCYH